MILDMKIEVKIVNQNRKLYEKKLSKKLRVGELVFINQREIPKSSRIEVECKCDICEKLFSRARVNIKNDNTLCSRECRNDWLRENNPSSKVEKVSVCCNHCNKEISIPPSKKEKQDRFFCGRECYDDARRVSSPKIPRYNYQNLFVPCETCSKRIKTTAWYIENKRNQFCTQECYWQHRRDYYKEFYYNPSLNNSRKETEPERLVREWLELNNIRFKQECGFLRKYFVDFYLKDYRVIVEVYGDYWHVNPKVYNVSGEEPNLKELNEYQLKWVESNYDDLRKDELESYDFPVFVLWEKDIHNNLDEVMNSMVSNIKNLRDDK